MKIILNVIMYLGIIIASLGIAMLIYGVHMFTFRGEFTEFEKRVAESSFLFWIPTILCGLILTATGFLIKIITKEKNIPIQRH